MTNWTKKEIKELRKHAYRVFGTEIPLSSEIEKIELFLEQKDFGFFDLPKITKTVQYSLRWFPNYWTHPMEIEIPNDVMEAIHKQCEVLLYERCNSLAELCGYKKEEE